MQRALVVVLLLTAGCGGDSAPTAPPPPPNPLSLTVDKTTLGFEREWNFITGEGRVTISGQVRNGASSSLSGVRVVATVRTSTLPAGTASGAVIPSTLAPNTSGSIAIVISLNGTLWTDDTTRGINAFTIEPSSSLGGGTPLTGVIEWE
jgi:hypothetical protein